MLTKKKLHQFIDEFTTRYASELSQGKDLRNRYWREMACFETGISHFIIGESYISEDGEKVVKIVNHFDDYGLYIYDNGYEEDVFIEHDDEQEYFFYEGKRYNSKNMNGTNGKGKDKEKIKELQSLEEPTTREKCRAKGIRPRDEKETL